MSVKIEDLKFHFSIVVVISIAIIASLLLGPSQTPSGFVVFSDNGITNNTIFTSLPIFISCNISSSDNIENITLYVFKDSSLVYTNTSINVTDNSSVNFNIDSLTNDNFKYYCFACDNNSCDYSSNKTFSVNISAFSGPVVNLTFNDENDPWKDYSMLNHIVSPASKIEWLANGKYYGSANMNASSSTELVLEASWSSMDGYAFSFWLNPVRKSSSNTMGYFSFDNGRTTLRVEDFEFGLAQTIVIGGEETTKSSSNAKVDADMWTHFAGQCDINNNVLQTWKNGVLVMNVSVSSCNVDYVQGSYFKIGMWEYDFRDVEGFLDEFLFWNESILNNTIISNIYEDKRMGTPPDFDLFVKDIKYSLPIDWSSDNNELLDQNMEINITIKNQGLLTTASNIEVSLIIDELEVDSWIISLDPTEEITLQHVWNKNIGFHHGSISININDDDLENNNIIFYIPFMNRPWFHFSEEEWLNDIKPHASDSTNNVAYGDFDWANSFGCSSFEEGYNGNSVDPYGKKARECALSCFVNDYTEPEFPTKQQCTSAKDHLVGWATRDINSYSNVQQLHELVQVGIAYDIMFPMLTQEENDIIIQGFYNICQHITNLPNTRPDLDEKDSIQGGNGFGFGSGMGGFCYSILGNFESNPSLLQETPDSYWGRSVVDSWMGREKAHLRAYKNDSFATYQEGWLYKFYAQFHLVENWWFEKKYGFDTTSNFDNALCSLGHDFALQTLDFNYNGRDLRNDENRNLRAIQRGDSNSYEDPGSGSIVKYAMITYYGLLCDNPVIKKQMLFLRNKANEINDDGLAYLDAFLFPQLFNQVGFIPKEIDSISPKFSFDNANDIVTIRTNYTYINDTVIQIDGGEERGGGHSQAQGYYLYALGESFLDYEQVPFEDDVRAETWKNGISLQNSNQVIEGTQGTYSSSCGNAPLNQYYGSGGCTKEGSYPDFRDFSLEYGGDIEDYIGTNDAYFSGTYVWRPYKNADPVQEYFIKFGDVLVKRTIVSNNLENNVYHNFINIFDEFSESRTGNNLTFSRNNKNLDISVIDSSVPLTLNGGDSGINYCFSKTNCETYFRGAGTYRRTYLHASTSDIDFILAHHWYTTGNQLTLSKIGMSDKGVSYSNNKVIFDSDNDGQTSFDGVITNGWALALNNDQTEIGSFNTTLITINNNPFFSSNIPISTFIKRSEEEIVITLNSMTRSVGIDTPREVTVTLDASYLSNNTNFQLRDKDDNIMSIDSESGSSLIFTVTPSQNSDTYTITGSSVVNNDPIVSLQSPENFFFTNFSDLSFHCFARDDTLVTNISILLNNSNNISILNSINPNNQSFTFVSAHNFVDGFYSWACKAIDNSARETTSSFRSFTVNTTVEEEIPNNPPAPDEPDDEPVTRSSSSSGSSVSFPVTTSDEEVIVEEKSNSNSKSVEEIKDEQLETASADIQEEALQNNLIENSEGVTLTPEPESPTLVAFSQDINLKDHLLSIIFAMTILFAAVIKRVVKDHHNL